MPSRTFAMDKPRIDLLYHIRGSLTSLKYFLWVTIHFLQEHDFIPSWVVSSVVYYRVHTEGFVTVTVKPPYSLGQSYSGCVEKNHWFLLHFYIA